jgi:hypothetical protein
MSPLQLLTRSVLRLALAAGFSIMAACGPGTGGTGTGTAGGQTLSALDSFGASGANICTTGPSSVLACPPPSNPSPVGAINPPSVANGTDGVLFSTTDGADINLTISGNQAILNDRCLSLAFEGDWGTVGGNDARFFGQYTTAGNAAVTLSSLTAEAAGADGKGLRVLLRDANGRVVIGPVTLRRTLVPTFNPAACNK